MERLEPERGGVTPSDPHHARPGEPAGDVATPLRELSDGVARLVVDHVELAKAELTEGLKRAGKDLAFVAAGALLAGLGWLLLMFAVAWGLGERFGMARSFLLVAAVHVVAGGLLATVFGARLAGRDKPMMDQTALELRRDKRFFKRIRRTLRAS